MTSFAGEANGEGGAEVVVRRGAAGKVEDGGVGVEADELRRQAVGAVPKLPWAGAGEAKAVQPQCCL